MHLSTLYSLDFLSTTARWHWSKSYFTSSGCGSFAYNLRTNHFWWHKSRNQIFVMRTNVLLRRFSIVQCQCYSSTVFNFSYFLFFILGRAV